MLHLAGTAGVASANGGEDSQLFSLTNQDRTSNGVHSLAFSGTLQNIGESAPYNCGGIRVSGRSYDMIRRNYFAHPILGCGQLVFSMMQAYGVRYRSAGENIGWEAYAPSPAGYINGQFMNSSDHRSNILNSSYTVMGVGSDESAPGVYWTGVARQQNVWMFSEEFAQVGSVVPAAAPEPAPQTRTAELPSAPAARSRAGHHGAGHGCRIADPHAGGDSAGQPSPGTSGAAGGSVRRPLSQHDRIRPRSLLPFRTFPFLKGQHPDLAQHRRSVCGRPRRQHRRRHGSPQGLPGEPAAA